MLNKAVWNQLERTQNEVPGFVVLRLYPESKLNIFAAVDKVTGHRFLLLKSYQRLISLDYPLPSGRGFGVRLTGADADPEKAWTLFFELTDLTHSDVFDVIGNDVLSHIINTLDDKSAFDMFVLRITEWQYFLDQLPKNGLSQQAQMGLFAELWFLLNYLLSNIPADKAVSSWAGPRALAKDFHFAGVAFEVKASSAKQPVRFSISNEQQLDSNGVGKLFLFCLLIEQVVNGGMSLPGLIKNIRETLRSHPNADIQFSELLIKAGYYEADAGHYDMNYTVRSKHFFEVREEFPRIVEDDLRSGVGDVKYSILLSECERYAVAEADMLSIIRSVHL